MLPISDQISVLPVLIYSYRITNVCSWECNSRICNKNSCFCLSANDELLFLLDNFLGHSESWIVSIDNVTSHDLWIVTKCKCIISTSLLRLLINELLKFMSFLFSHILCFWFCLDAWWSMDLVKYCTWRAMLYIKASRACRRRCCGHCRRSRADDMFTAALLEVERLACPVPLSLPRRASRFLASEASTCRRARTSWQTCEPRIARGTCRWTRTWKTTSSIPSATSRDAHRVAHWRSRRGESHVFWRPAAMCERASRGAVTLTTRLPAWAPAHWASRGSSCLFSRPSCCSACSSRSTSARHEGVCLGVVCWPKPFSLLFIKWAAGLFLSLSNFSKVY